VYAVLYAVSSYSNSELVALQFDGLVFDLLNLIQRPRSRTTNI